MNAKLTDSPNQHPFDGTPLIDPALYDEHKAALATGREGRTLFGRSCSTPEELDLILTYRQNEIKAEQAPQPPMIGEEFLARLFVTGQAPGAQEGQIRLVLGNLERQIHEQCQRLNALTEERDQLQRELTWRADEAAYSLQMEDQRRNLAEKNALLAASNDILRAENSSLKERLAASTLAVPAETPPAPVSSAPLAPPLAASASGSDISQIANTPASGEEDATERDEVPVPNSTVPGRRRGSVSNAPASA